MGQSGGKIGKITRQGFLMKKVRWMRKWLCVHVSKELDVEWFCCCNRDIGDITGKRESLYCTRVQVVCCIIEDLRCCLW